MTVSVEIPGEPSIEIDHLLLDVNGTLTDRGSLLDGVDGRISRLRRDCEVHLLSADTFGAMIAVARILGTDARRITSGAEKRDLAREFGADACAAIGNGRNDAGMLAEARLGIAVVGPEGLSGRALAAADVICSSIQIALDLLLEPRALSATLRA